MPSNNLTTKSLPSKGSKICNFGIWGINIAIFKDLATVNDFSFIYMMSESSLFFFQENEIDHSNLNVA